MLRKLIITLCTIIGIASAQNDDTGNGLLYFNLTFIIIPVAVFIIFVIGIIIGAYLIYRVHRYGAFCCCSLSMRYKPNYQSNAESKVDKTLPPYMFKPHPQTAPPNYQDVLKDELVDNEGNADNIPLVV